MEVVVSILIMAVIILGIFSLIVYSINLTSENKFYVEAIQMANQKMEQIRNLPYDDVGTVTGSPAGVVPEYETVVREGTFEVHTTITFYDDEYDGTLDLGTDNIFTDYKIATIEVSWETRFGSKNVTVFSKIIPNTEETLTGYGLIKLLVNDADGLPVPFADVHIENSAIVPILNADYTTDEDGELTLAVLPALESYEITVTKTDYGTDKTYTRGELIEGVANDEPTRPHWSVFAEAKTEDSFSIDLLGNLNIRVVSTNQPDNNLINETRPTRNQIKPKMSKDTNGNIYFVWEDYTATSSYVYVQKLNSSFVSQWSSEYKIYTTNFQTNPDIVTSANGTSFVVWQDNSSTLKQIAKNNGLNNKYALEKVRYSNQTSLFADSYFEKLLNLSNFKIKEAKEKLNIFKFFTRSAKAAGEQVTLVAVGPGSVTDDTSSIDLNVPVGVQADDLLIAFLHHDDASDGPMIPPAGEDWNTLNNNMNPSGASSDSRGGIFWKIADSSEPASYNFDLNNSYEEIAGHIRAYRGVDLSDPFDENLEWRSTSYYNTLINAPTHDVNNDGSMLVCGWGADTYTLGNNNPDFPGSMGNTENNFGPNVTSASADQEVDTSDSPTGNKTFDANQWVTRATASWCLVLKPQVLPDDATVTSLATQTATTTIPTTNFYVGGKFVITENNSNRNVTDVTITEDGIVDAQDALSNARLYYDLDTTSPYDCAGEEYNSGLDSQFGSIEEFNGADGIAQFSEVGGVEISTTQSLCLYLVVDVDSSAMSNDSIEIKIDDPSTDVVVDSGTVIPNTPVEIVGATQLLKPAELNQIHYRFRNDDNNEVNATWTENTDTPTQITKETPLRLRFEISNEGDQISDQANYRIEYGAKVSSCENIVSWQSLPNDNSLHWRVISSSYYSDGDPTTNVADGLSDENINFVAGEIKDTSNQTSAIQLDDDEFTEIEYSLQATTNATDSSYCFRLTNAGSTSSFNYAVYPEASVIGDENIYIISLDTNSNVNWNVVKVNSDSSSYDQTEPQIAITENFGNATTTIIWTDERSGNQDIYAQSFDKNGNKLWTNDLAIATGLSNENSPDIYIDANDTVFTTWVEENTSKDIYVQKYNLSGTAQFGSNINLISSTTDEYYPSIITDSSGNFYITWTELDVLVEKVYVAKYNSSATNLWQTQANIGDLDGPQYGSNLMINGSYLYVSWTDEGEGNLDIYIQKYDLSGTAQWSEDLRVNINSGSSSQDNSFLNFDSLNNNYAVWQDERNGVYDIYATKFLDSSTLNGVSSVPIIVTGTKQIGDNPIIYEYVEEFSSDASGYVNVPVEWDVPGYSIELKTSETTYELIMSDPIQPFEILPNEVKNILLYVR